MNPNFKFGKEIYFDRIKLTRTKSGEPIKWDPNSIYAICARDGLCFRCKRTDTDPNHRPKHVMFGLCPECDADLSYGYEKIERKAKLQVHEWFKD